MNIREEIRAARGGDIVALEKIAWRYHIGDGVRKSEKKSLPSHTSLKLSFLSSCLSLR